MRANLTCLALALVAASLSGCIHEVNHPPVVNLTASITSGDAPLVVYWTEHIFDVDGDALNVTIGTDGTNSVFFSVPEHNGLNNDTSYFHDSQANTVFYNPGYYNETMTVTDGVYTVSPTVQIHVTGLRTFVHLVLDTFSNVTAICTVCSNTAGQLAAVGADGCQGLLTNKNGTDCVWFELRPEWEGNTFYSNTTTGSDVDLEIRSACTLGADKLSIYLHDGYESGNIPPGGRCMVLWIYTGPPSTIELKVFP